MPALSSRIKGDDLVAAYATVNAVLGWLPRRTPIFHSGRRTDMRSPGAINTVVNARRSTPNSAQRGSGAGPGMSLAIDQTAAFHLDKTVGADPRLGKKM